jgi:hypothetical protein
VEQKWGVGPEVFTPENARAYGRFLGRRYRDRPVVWILGGDRSPEAPGHLAVVRAMAEGLREGDGGAHLMTYHPMGASRRRGTSTPTGGWRSTCSSRGTRGATSRTTAPSTRTARASRPSR